MSDKEKEYNKEEQNIIVKAFIDTFEEIYGEINDNKKQELMNLLQKEFFKDGKIINPELKFILDLLDLGLLDLIAE